MLKFLIVLLLTIISNNSFATIKIAMLDTGIISTSDIKMCPNGVLDFTEFKDKTLNPHGQNVSHIITKNLKNVDYCLYSIRIFDRFGHTKMEWILTALRYLVVNTNIDILNVSEGGTGFNLTEKTYIDQLINKGVIIVAAAGNENNNLDTSCNFYPNCYNDDIISVSCLKYDGVRCKSANFGNSIKLWAVGDKINAGGYEMTGTSQATAVVTNDLVLFINKRNKKK